MSLNYEEKYPLPVSEAKAQELFTSAMARVYLWMFLGLALTTAVALYVSSSPQLLFFIFSNFWVLMVLFVVEMALVIGVTAALNKLSTGAALGLFFLYAAINGATLAIIFIAYTTGTIVMAFGTTALLFGVMSIVGYTTKQDLTKWGPILFMGLIGLIIASVVNMFLANSTLDWIITYAGVLLFLALTVYDTKKIKEMTLQLASTGDTEVIAKVGVMGALKLYLDFINLFLFILRIFGRRR